MWTKGLSTTRKDSANNKSNYSEKGLPNLDSRSRRFRLERVFGERRIRSSTTTAKGQPATLYYESKVVAATVVWVKSNNDAVGESTGRNHQQECRKCPQKPLHGSSFMGHLNKRLLI